MSTPDLNSVLKVLREATDFTYRAGAEKEAAALEEFDDRFQKEKATFKVLRGAVDNAMNQAAGRVREILLDENRMPRPGMETLANEHERIWSDFLKLIYPPEWEEIDISSCIGSHLLKKKFTGYKGDPNGVQPVVERSIELIQRYSKLIGRGDFDAAYLLTAAGLRDWMSKKRFVTEHEQAAKLYRGPALDFLIDQFQFVYADDPSRQKSKADEGWPKATPKEERRSCATGFWIRDRAAQTGCCGGFLISQEHDEYRIAKFTFYRP